MTDIWLRQWFYNELDNIFAVMDPANGAPIVLPSQVASPGEIFSSRGYSQTTNGIGGTNGSIEQFFQEMLYQMEIIGHLILLQLFQGQMR